MKTIEKRLRLDNIGVDMASREICAWLTETGMDRREILRIQLTMEELLLRISQHFSGNISGTLLLGRRLGSPIIRFRYKAEAFDPTQQQEDEIGAWTDRILSHMGLIPVWSYRFGQNELIQRISARKLPSWLFMLGALAAAILLGLGGMSFPERTRSAIALFILSPCSDIFMRMLSVFIEPIVFLSIINGICGMGSAAEFGRLGKQMIVRFIGFSFLGSAAMVMTRPFFAGKEAGLAVSGGASQLDKIRDMLLDFIPSNLMKPFTDGNIMQIVFLAVFLGIVLLNIKEKSTHILELAADLYDIVMLAISIVCRLLPIYIFASITLQIWANGIKTLASLWKPVVIGTAMWSIFLASKTIIVHLKHKVKISVLLKKILPGMMIGFTTASGAIAYSHCTKTNEEKLGIAPNFSRIGQSIGGVLYQPCLSTLFALTAYNAAEAYGAFGDFGWMLTAWFICPILAFAVPPVAGGVLACVGILFSQLGIPSEALATASITIFLLDFISTGFSLGLRHLELVLQAGDLGMLDTDVLRK